MNEENFKIKFINLKYLEDFEYDPGNDIHLIIGENGAGKSVMMRHIRFLSYTYLQHVDILSLNANQICDHNYNDLFLDNIILADAENNEFGYEFHSYDQIYSIFFIIDFDDNILKLNRIKIEWKYKDSRSKICHFKFISNKEEIRDEVKSYEHLLDKQREKLKIEKEQVNSYSELEEISWNLEKLEEIANGQILFFELEFDLQEYMNFVIWMKESNIVKNFTFTKELNKILSLPQELELRERFITLKVAIERDDFVKGYGSSVLSLQNIFENCMLYIPRLGSIQREDKYPSELYESINDKAIYGIIYHFYRELNGDIEFFQILEGQLKKNHERWDSTRTIDEDYVPPRLSQVIEKLYKDYSLKAGDDLIRLHDDWNFLRNDGAFDFIYLVDATIFRLESSILRRTDYLYPLFAFYSNSDKIKDVRQYLKIICNIDDIEVRFSDDDLSSIVVKIIRKHEKIHISALSTGELHSLLVLLKVYSTNSDIYLKEIDVYLHPNKQSELLQAIIDLCRLKKGGFSRLFVESHSPYFLRKLQLMRVEDAGYRNILNRTKILYRSRDPLFSKEILIKDNGDLTTEIPAGYSDHLTRLNMLRFQFID